jgi:Flp pilus assembly pilin Flp
MKEKNSSFLCPTNTVMTGRYHGGDENGQTQYEYATLKAIDGSGNPVAGTITVEDVRWESSFKESSGNGYVAPANRVIVGRQHSGDENGQTKYATAIINFNAQSTTLSDGINSSNIKESSGIWFRTDQNRVITGRHHSGDENGQTYYGSATIFITVGASTDPAPAGTIIVPNIRTASAVMTESSSWFLCPAGTVITGRSHTGDENGSTQYEYATLKALDPQGRIVIGTITIEDVQWEKVFLENSGKGYDAPLNRIIVGRQHSGDENGTTQYATGIIKFNGHATEIINYTTSDAKTESSGWSNWFKTDANQVVTGRHHFGDENGNTYYCMGTVSCDITVKPQERFKVVVLLYPGEDNCPMNTQDFIRLSRFRRHNANGSDDGYNKNTEQFVNNNDHGSEYYDIPASVINSYLVTNPRYALYNLRPRDKNSIGSGEVFLEPDDNLQGDFDPNGRVPVYTYSTYYTTASNVHGERREFWVFYGYDYAQTGLSFSHQGDWERIMLDIVNNSIQGAWLSQHTKLVYYSASQLQITEENGMQTLTVYSAIGSHAHYPSAGQFDIYDVLGIPVAYDYTANGGYQWVITDNYQPLNSQPWRDYAGAWGEIGEKAETTGPLGPRYKQFDFGCQSDANIALSSLISYGQILIIPDIRAESDEISESDGDAFETPADTLITGRQHNKDENGKTKYEYATLKAIDYTGTIVDGTISIVDRQWSDWHKESDSGSFFQAPQGRVLTGRQHAGDENGNTRYQTAVVLFNGNSTSVVSAGSLLPDVSVKESGGTFFRSASRFILVGRTHTGDENGETTYYQGYIYQG